MCGCGNTPGFLISRKKSGICDVDCAGDNSSTCGGNVAYALYKTIDDYTKGASISYLAFVLLLVGTSAAARRHPLAAALQIGSDRGLDALVYLSTIVCKSPRGQSCDQNWNLGDDQDTPTPQPVMASTPEQPVTPSTSIGDDDGNCKNNKCPFSDYFKFSEANVALMPRRAATEECSNV